MLPNFQLLQAIKSNCLSDFNDAVSRGAASSARDLDGRSALEVAFRHSRPDFARRLIQDGAEPNPTIGKRGNRLIHLAAQTGDFGFLTVILEAGIKINSIGNCRRTPLHIATSNGFEYLSRTLLENTANPDATDDQGNVPLHFVANKGNATMARLLISFNANASVTNNQLYTPMHNAVANGHTEVAKLLLNREQAIDSKFKSSGIVRRLLRVAELHNQTSTVSALCDFE